MADNPNATASKGEGNPKKQGGGKKKGKGKGKGKKADAPPETTHRCFHCQTESTKMMCCSQCHRAWYCGRPCQKKHWKQHKKACVAAVAAEARRSTLRRKATAARAAAGGGVDKETCVICVGPVVAPVELPCGHAYCAGCLAELRTKKVAQACPLCRAELPPGVDGLYELAWRAHVRIEGMVDRGEVAWAALPAAEQEEMDEVEAMYTEAAAQGHSSAAFNLGLLLQNVRGDFDGAVAAYRTAITADPGHADAHFNLGTVLKSVREDFDGAEAAYRAAIAADPGHADAHINLGILLQNVRGDFDGAEAAYRAAITVDPGHAAAHFNLGLLLETMRKDFDGAEAAYRAAIAADPGHAGAHINLGNVLQNVREDFDGAEAVYRAAIAADPGYAKGHSNLGILLNKRAQRIEENGGDLTAAAALYDECAVLWGFCHGVDSKFTESARARAARVRRELA